MEKYYVSVSENILQINMETGFTLTCCQFELLTDYRGEYELSNNFRKFLNNGKIKEITRKSYYLKVILRMKDDIRCTQQREDLK